MWYLGVDIPLNYSKNFIQGNAREKSVPSYLLFALKLVKTNTFKNLYYTKKKTLRQLSKNKKKNIKIIPFTVLYINLINNTNIFLFPAIFKSTFFRVEIFIYKQYENIKHQPTQ
jgi:hypothetical protein